MVSFLGQQVLRPKEEELTQLISVLPNPNKTHIGQCYSEIFGPKWEPVSSPAVVKTDGYDHKTTADPFRLRPRDEATELHCKCNRAL